MLAFLKLIKKKYNAVELASETTALEDAVAGLADAEKQSLTEQTMAEYSAAQVICHRAMAEFQQKRTARLAEFIQTKGSTP